MNKLVATVAAGVLMALAVPGVASAKGGGGVKVKGTCSANSRSELKVKTDEGRIEAEFEVDQNVAGHTWKVVLSDDGAVVARGKHTTAAPSGSFEFETRIPNRAGTDTVRASAKNLTTGETCSAQASI